MSYNSHLSGELAIEPPLRWAQFKDSDFYGAERAREASKAVRFIVAKEQVETDDGLLDLRLATGLTFAWDYRVDIRNILDELQGLVDAFPGHEFKGEFEGEGEQFGDIWRIRVVDRRVERLLPTITWPDGTTTVIDRYQGEAAKRRRR